MNRFIKFWASLLLFMAFILAGYAQAFATDTANKGYTLQGTGTNRGTWGIELNNILSTIDLNLGGRIEVSVAGSSDVPVSATNAKYIYHKLTGILTGNIEYILPDAGGFYYIENATTGSFTLEVSCVDEGTSVTIGSGDTAIVYVNATDNAVVAVAQAKNTQLSEVAATSPADNDFLVGSSGGAWTAENASTARNSMGAQALDATLTALAGWANGTNKLPYTTSTDTVASLDFKDEDDMVSDSATAVPSQQSVKAYVDALAGIKDVQSFTAGGTWTKPSGFQSAIIIYSPGSGGGSSSEGTDGTAGGNTSIGAVASATGGSPGTAFISPPNNSSGFSLAADGSCTSNDAFIGWSPGGHGGFAVVAGNGFFGQSGGKAPVCIKTTSSMGATETITIGAAGSGGSGGAGHASGESGETGFVVILSF